MPDIQSRLAEVEPIYKVALRLRAEWESLQSLDQARAEYESLLKNDEKELTHWEGQKADLERMKRSLERARPTRPRSFLDRKKQEEKVAPPPPPLLPVRSTKRVPLEARRRFQMLATRYKFQWRLDESTRARINLIVDNNDRPLGEAIALLDWSAFRDRLQDERKRLETEQNHLDRVSEWGQDLQEYVEKLKGDIHVLQASNGEWMMSVWRYWRARAEGAEGQTRWEELIAGKRAAIRNRTAQLKEEIATLEAIIARLRESLTARKEQS